MFQKIPWIFYSISLLLSEKQEQVYIQEDKRI